jgi:hypothetical protein
MQARTLRLLPERPLRMRRVADVVGPAWSRGPRGGAAGGPGHPRDSSADYAVRARQVEVDFVAANKAVLDSVFHAAGGPAPKEDWFWLRLSGCRRPPSGARPLVPNRPGSRQAARAGRVASKMGGGGGDGVGAWRSCREKATP